MFSSRAESLSRLIAGNHFLELSRLLDDENRLTAQIADPAQIDRKTIGEVIVVAKRLAVADFPLRLVALDEILDIAQIFAAVNPDAAGYILERLQTELEKETSSLWKDPVWTARVAAVLAYFSALK